MADHSPTRKDLDLNQGTTIIPKLEISYVRLSCFPIDWRVKRGALVPKHDKRCEDATLPRLAIIRLAPGFHILVCCQRRRWIHTLVVASPTRCAF